jgi:predicted DsbA family dithiol-disulfide isomerase
VINAPRLAGSVAGETTGRKPEPHPGRRETTVDGARRWSVDPIRAIMKVTYFVEILSSWCHWAEPAWDEIKARYAGRVEFTWRIALMKPEDFPVSRAQCDWFYRRSGGTTVHAPYMLNSGWLEPERQGDYLAPNLVAEAGRDFLGEDDRLRRALTHAALRDGRKIGDLAVAVEVGAAVLQIAPDELRARAESASVRARVEASTATFHAHQIGQRPSFILENAIGDKVVISGLWVAGPLAAAIDAMLADAAAYAAHRAHHGTPPAS